MNRKIRAHFLLFVTAFIWGSAFVAQRIGMDHIGPYTFIAIRMLISAIVLTPAILYFDRNAKSSGERREVSGKSDKTLFAGLCCGVVLFMGAALQQTGLVYTTAGKAGFLTTMYIILVPLLGLFMRKRVSKKIWFCVFIAVVGIYLLCMVENLQMNRGDILMLFSALSWALHIIVIDYFSPYVNALRLSRMQFFVCSMIAFACMFAFESPEMSSILAAWLPLLYAAVLSGAVGFTLQIIAQKDTNPTIAALILSFEAVFAVLTGFAILSEILSVQEILGCILMFAAVIIAQLPEKSKIDKLKGTDVNG